jgi:hypothetical protein
MKTLSLNTNEWVLITLSKINPPNPTKLKDYKTIYVHNQTPAVSNVKDYITMLNWVQVDKYHHQH